MAQAQSGHGGCRSSRRAACARRYRGGAGVRAQRAGVRVASTFGASGCCKDRIVAGERRRGLRSANMEHPQALARRAGRAVRRFARNAMCALARPPSTSRRRTLLAFARRRRSGRHLAARRPTLPGDYAWSLFDRVEAGRAGAFAALTARRCSSRAAGFAATAARVAASMPSWSRTGQADVFVTYCTNASQARREQPELRSLPCRRLSTSAAGMALR